MNIKKEPLANSINKSSDEATELDELVAVTPTTSTIPDCGPSSSGSDQDQVSGGDDHQQHGDNSNHSNHTYKPSPPSAPGTATAPTSDDDNMDFDSDGDDDDDSKSNHSNSNTSPNAQFSKKGEGKGDVKRSHHNVLERKRRDLIKDSFSRLREAVPTLSSERASRAQILKKAADFIQFTQQKNDGFRANLDELVKKNAELAAVKKVKNLVDGDEENL